MGAMLYLFELEIGGEDVISHCKRSMAVEEESVASGYKIFNSKWPFLRAWRGITGCGYCSNGQDDFGDDALGQ